MPERPPLEHATTFSHDAHPGITCVQCHTQPVSLEPEPPVATCVSCHDQHHSPARSCASCHASDQMRQAHAPPVDPHRDCDDCHTPARVATLLPARTLCLTCHVKQDHYAPRQCTVCHFQTSPELYRKVLTRTEARR
jgi:hypothetical protein